jgi:hypothetical protein
MIEQTALDALWGGVITAWSLAIEDFRLELDVSVTEDAKTSRYQVTFDEVTGLEFENEGAAGWDYIDLTSIELKEASGRGQLVVMEFWNGVAWAGLRCAKLSILPKG